MTLLNGKFYKDGEVVPVEFGNNEQIKLIRDQEKRIEMFNGDGLEVDVEHEIEVTAYTHFKCICGKQINMEASASSDDDFECLEGKKSTCGACKRAYEVVASDYGSVYIKLKK